MSDGRANVYPQALLYGARPLSVPGRGAVLCASAGLAIRLSDGAAIKPNDYYAAVSRYAGKTAIPDSMSPLPCSELLVLGPIPRPDAQRKARIRCGGIDCRLLLNPDPEAVPDEVFTAGAADAVWHARDNPDGRGGPEDDRKPLIVREGAAAEPVWFGVTPFDHPLRTRQAGASATMKDGWPSDADPAVLCDAHAAFRTSALHAGDTLEIEGLGPDAVSLTLPSYRIAMATSRLPSGKWRKETTRIHTIVAIPAADMGAIFWRAAIGLGDDILGEKIFAVVVALEDIDAAEKDEEDLGIIAAERWLDPPRALDDRPLLPAAMAAAGAPKPPPDAAEQAARHEAAKDWARKEFGVETANPFEDPEAVAEADDIIEAAEDGKAPDMDKLGAIGDKAMAESKRRHSEAGFDPPAPEEQRPPVERGEALAAEIRERLASPYRSPREVAIFDAMEQAPPDAGVDAMESLGRISDARLLATEPVLTWPALTDSEAEKFGEEVFRKLSSSDTERHIDISGAHIGAGAKSRRKISGRNFEELLAEETVWREIEFTDCNFRGVTFAKGSFDNCIFQDCRFENVNLSMLTMRDVAFVRCSLRDQTALQLNCITGRFDECEFESLNFVDLAIRDTPFNGGSWTRVEFSDSLLMRLSLRQTRLDQVTFSLCHAPECKFEQVSMHKVWVMGYGFAQSTFEGVAANTCGFLGKAHFQQCRFERSHFERTGFSNARFDDARFTSDCVFDRCDFSGTKFNGAQAAGVRFLECSLTMSVWEKADANDAWFMDGLLRGVDFSQTNLINAIFTGSDIEGAQFDERLIVGADFRGTVRSG